MSPRKKKIGYYTKLDPQLREAMRRYKENVGVPEAQQIERALKAWLRERPEAWRNSPVTVRRGRGTRER